MPFIVSIWQVFLQFLSQRTTSRLPNFRPRLSSLTAYINISFQIWKGCIFKDLLKVKSKLYIHYHKYGTKCWEMQLYARSSANLLPSWSWNRIHWLLSRIAHSVILAKKTQPLARFTGPTYGKQAIFRSSLRNIDGRSEINRTNLRY